MNLSKEYALVTFDRVPLNRIFRFKSEWYFKLNKTLSYNYRTRKPLYMYKWNYVGISTQDLNG